MLAVLVVELPAIGPVRFSAWVRFPDVSDSEVRVPPLSVIWPLVIVAVPPVTAVMPLRMFVRDSPAVQATPVPLTSIVPPALLGAVARASELMAFAGLIAGALAVGSVARLSLSSASA